MNKHNYTFLRGIVDFLKSEEGKEGTFLFPSKMMLNAFFNGTCATLKGDGIKYDSDANKGTIKVGNTVAVFVNQTEKR